MPSLSSADHRARPPLVFIPRDYNLAHDLIERNLASDRATKVAYIDDAGRYTFGDLAARVNRAANALCDLGLQMEERILLCHLDTIDWPAVFLGAIKAGIVPIAVNTRLTTADYEFMLRDSRARGLVVSEALYPAFAPLIGKLPFLRHIIVSGNDAKGHLHLQALMAKAGSTFSAAATTCDDTAFWQSHFSRCALDLGKHWQLLMGSFIVVVALFLPNGLLGLLSRLARWRESSDG